MASPAAGQITITSPNPLTQRLLTPECVDFLAVLHRAHNSTRRALLAERVTRAILFDKGLPLVKTYDFFLFIIKIDLSSRNLCCETS